MKFKNLILVLAFLPLSLFAQEKIEVGLFVGKSSHGGDLVEPDFFFGENSQFGFGFFGRLILTENVNVRANLMFSRLEGDDRNYPEDLFRTERSISFESPLTEFSVVAEYEPFAKNRYSEDGEFKRIFSPYVFAGLGLAFINPTTDYSRSEVDGVAEDQNADASNAQLVIPLGLGVRYDISEKVNVGVELGMRPSTTDYLDGVSFAGNSDKNDWFHFFGVTVSTKLGKKAQIGSAAPSNY